MEQVISHHIGLTLDVLHSEFTVTSKSYSRKAWLGAQRSSLALLNRAESNV